MIKISIIIPIYNVEKYLEECLSSVYSLDLSNKEVILINDGSKDNSFKIAKKYKLKYSENTILINQKNKGLSGARNTGIRNSSGEYLFFLDSDDFINTEELEDFFKRGLELEQDILMGNYYEYYDKKNKRIFQYSNLDIEIKNRKGLDILEEGIKNKSFPVVVWNKLYKKDFLNKNGLFFKEGLLHEDNLFTLTAFSLGEKVAYINKIIYNYRQTNLSSITKTMSEKNYLHMMYIINELIEFQDRQNKNNKYYNRFLIGMYWKIIKEGKLKNKRLLKKIIKLKCNFLEKLKIIFIIFISILIKKEVKEIPKI